MRKINNNNCDQSGFTLIEILVSIMLLSVIMAAVFSFLWGASRYWQNGQNQADITENARSGLNRMTRELKQSSAILTAGPSQIAFTVNFGAGEETIAYGITQSGSEPGFIWRTSGTGPAQTMINDVDAVSFDYYGNDYRCDSDGNGIVNFSELNSCGANPETKIARVDIGLSLRIGNDSPQNFVGQAWLRNRNVS